MRTNACLTILIFLIGFKFSSALFSTAGALVVTTIANISHNHTTGGGVLFLSWCTF